MIDLDEYLSRERRAAGEAGAAPGQVYRSRSELLTEARKTLRYHLQRQLIEELRHFGDGNPPPGVSRQ